MDAMKQWTDHTKYTFHSVVCLLQVEHQYNYSYLAFLPPRATNDIEFPQ
jgi:hypothetical protein